MPKRWIYPAGLVVVLLIAFYIYRKYHVAPEINLDALSLTDTGGNPVTLRSMKGKKMVVCFGASWCGSCRKELKDIAAVKGTALNDAEVIVISDEPLEKVQMLKDKTN